MRSKNEELLGKNHSIRCSDEDWYYILSIKPHDKSWGLFLRELVEIIKKIKEL
jgi:hypothetical protein